LDAKNTNNKFNITAEEAAVFFAMKLEQDRRLKEKRADSHGAMEDATFKKNFWRDWKVILGKGHKITSLSDVDFNPMIDFLVERSEQRKLAKKAMSKEEKALEKQQKEGLKELYGYALVDGVRIPIGNYMIQPPGLYMGHGKHPYRGKIKKRMRPEDVTLNVSRKYVPKCFTHGKPCRWGDTVENRDVTWIGTWKHPITGENNYFFLKREESHWVCMDDLKKFEKARKLEKNIKAIRKQYKRDMRSGNAEKKQLATAVYLLDELAIRPGTEKDESREAGTLGLTTLKCSNVTFKGRNTIKINFMGKSSIKFDRTVVISPYAYGNMESICRGAAKSKSLFPKVNANSLNAYLKTLLPGLSAKVFRTWKASSILQRELEENVPRVDVATHTKKLTYDRVNIAVALALNHKRMTANTGKIKKLKAEIKKLKAAKKTAKTVKQKAAKQKSIDLRITKLAEAEGNVAMTTSKVNYLDPRITVAWAKKAEMPIEKLYNKTQLRKFVWSMGTEDTWKF
jgi:DNA topoisomerase-1